MPGYTIRVRAQGYYGIFHRRLTEQFAARLHCQRAAKTRAARELSDAQEVEDRVNACAADRCSTLTEKPGSENKE